ncbi:hypothetical protein sos41_38820 [Alphaproteobacteria bacterium SO-S41]|nr:hypothetical protein sos41_38820 [Alphaproteobacteria bacterium SO-S41]
MSENNNRQEGIVVAWDDERGFGFAEVPGAPQHVFVHIKFLRHKHVRPAVGEKLSFTIAEGRNGRTAAADIEIVGAPPPPPPKPAPVAVPKPPRPPLVPDFSRLFAAVVLIGGALIAYGIGRAPAWVPGLYCAMGLVSGTLYAFDKDYARGHRRRVRELSLHLADALFGVAGGLFAQHVFRHKTRKLSFRYVTRLIFVAHATFLAALLSGLIALH